jgi:FAD/FMN-containing dehydrogenase
MTILDEDLTFRDVHCRLSCTSVRAVDRPASTAEVQAIVRDAARRRESLAIAGSRYAGGGQAVLSGGRLVDMRGMRRVGPVDARRGLVEVEAGVTWPALIDALLAAQAGDATVWSVRQKQTGADRLTVGGAVSANAHGRGLGMGPIVDDVEALTLVDADGAVRYCDRSGDSQLFALAIGGYGLLGVITKVVLRLAPRCKLAREVEVRDLAGVVAALEARRAEGCLYGDFQFSTDERAPGFMRRGVLASYRPVPPETPVPVDRRALSDDDWARLVHLGHVDRRAAYEAYIGHYLATHGQVYFYV